MTDIIDAAGETAELFLGQDMALHRARQAAEAAQPVNADGLCMDCEEPIEALRLAANPRVTRCVSCQCDHERRTGQYR